MNFLRRLRAVCMLQNRQHKSVQNSSHTSRVSPLEGSGLSPHSCVVAPGSWWREDAFLSGVAGWECPYLGNWEVIHHGKRRDLVGFT